MRVVYQNTFWHYHVVQIHVLHASKDTLLMDLDSTLRTVITKEIRKIVGLLLVQKRQALQALEI